MSHSKVLARHWKQVRISPEEASAVTHVAKTYGMAFPAALRQVLRRGAGLPCIFDQAAPRPKTKGKAPPKD